MKKFLIKSLKFSASVLVLVSLLFVNMKFTSAGSCSSAGTGDWATGGTWGAGCTGAGGIPAVGDNVTILNSHNVTIATGVSGVATNVTVNNGGTLTITSSGTLSLSGNYINNGTTTGTGALNLTGTGTTIDGTGAITLSGLTTITNTKTILSSANLAFSGSLTISSGTTTNNGTISVGGDLTITSTLNLLGNSITVSGDAINNGTLNINSVSAYYRSITIDHTKVPNTDQTDFPVLITGTYDGSSGKPDLRTVANGGKVQNASGYDVGFYSDSALTTKLKWETEKYTASTGEVVYWVKVPTLSHTSDTVIYIGYGNPGITTDQSDKVNVWDSNFKAVYHMADNAANGTITDSIGNSNETNSVNTSTVTTTGKIGSAISNAGSDYASGSYNSAMNLTAGVTLSAWVYFNDVSTIRTIVGKPYAGSHTSPYWEWFMGSANNAFGNKYVIRIGNTEILSNTAATTGTWHHIVETADGTNIKQYIDGTLDKTTADSTLPANSNSIGVRIGANVANGENMNGNIDQIEVSSSARSADWITTQYNNQSSPSTFYTIGSETTVTIYIAPSGGSYYRTITIDHTKVQNTDQTDFPVMIKDTFDGSSGKPDLRTVANGGKVQNANGYDIGFYSDSALTTKLKWETVSYSATTGTAEYWVKIPSLSHTTDTVIYLGYGNATITSDQSDRINVWDSNYKSVWHLKDGTSLSGSDSTTNALDLTLTNTPTAVTGKVDGGADMGTTGRFQVTNTGFNLTDFTYEMWVNTNSDTDGYLLERGNGGSSLGAYLWYQASGLNRWVFGFNNGTSYVDHFYGDTLTSSFRHFVYVMDDTNNLIKLYIDGVEVKNEAETTSPTTAGTQVLNFATNQSGANHFDSYMDEIRVSGSARSADYVKTVYNNESSPTTFYTFGSEVPPPPTTMTITVGGNWTNTGTFTADTSTIKLTYTGSSGKTFAGGGATYYNLWLAHGSGTGSYTISGNNTFNDFKDDGTVAHSILFTTGSTQHVTTWNVSGNSGQLITINSTTTGTHSLIKDGAGVISANYLNIQHSVATPVQKWFAGSNSINNQSTATAGSGWIFNPERLYRGGGGSTESSASPNAAQTGGGQGGGTGTESSGGSGSSSGGGQGGGGDTGFIYSHSNLAFAFGAFDGLDLVTLLRQLFK